jgi:hypothetical protein
MLEIAQGSVDSKRLHAVPRIFEPELRLPAHLADLPSRARAHVGRMIDDQRVRLLLDRDGRVLVVRGGPT